MSVQATRLTRCPSCGSDDLVTISMTMVESDILFRACHGCENRWWERDGYTVSLDTVVDLIPKR